MKSRFEQTKESIIAVKFILQKKICQASKIVSSSTNRKHFRALVHGHGHGLPAASLAEMGVINPRGSGWRARNVINWQGRGYKHHITNVIAVDRTYPL